MNLPYDGEYRSHLLTKFRTLRDPQDLMLLLPAINALSFLDVSKCFFKQTNKLLTKIY